MGFFDFFKNIFGKKTCAFCGEECGMMSRTKIKGDEYICSKCDDDCSNYIRKSRFTKQELEGHMEYMRRSNRIYNEVIAGNEPSFNIYPSAVRYQGIEFFDSFGMFRIVDPSRDNKGRYPVELFRYDQVANYEPFIEEDEPEEPGKEKVFVKGGINITLVGAMDDTANMRKGLRPHPYITETIEVCFSNSEHDKDDYMKYVDNAISHFDYIFGVHDSSKGLFNFGMSTQEKRDLKAAVAFTKTAFDAIKVAKDGGEVSEEKKAEVMENMNAIDDAQTGGLAVYTRRADAAEDKIK